MGDVNPVRVQLVEPLETRDQTTNFDSKMVNCITERSVRGGIMARKRPGIQAALQGVVGVGQGITNYQNSVYSVSGDFLNSFAGGAALTAVQATGTAAWSKRVGAFTVGFNGKLWVMGGWSTGTGTPLNDVWNSTDGANWTQVASTSPWAARGKGQLIVFNNTMFLLGGAASTTGTHYGDVWSTTDGVHWTQTSTAAFPGRRRFGACVFNGQLWVAGGEGADATTNNWPHTMFSDVYTSIDGAAWTKTVAQAPWIARSNFAFFGINGRLRVVGGELTDPFTNATSDLWSSADGVTWTRDSANPFGVAASSVWPVGAFTSFGMDFTLPAPITISGGNGSGAAAWAFTDVDDDWDDTDLQPGPYVQLTFNNVGSGYTTPPNIAFGTSIGFPAGAYAMLNGASNGGAKWCYSTQLGNTIYILEFSANGGSTYDHVVWSTTDGVTYTQVNVSFPSGWSPREGEWFGYGNLWFLDGFDGTNLFNDVWFISLGSANFALSPNVASLFYHFNQTSTAIAQPLLVFKSTKDLYSFNASLQVLTKLSNVANYPATTVPGLAYLDGYFFVMDPQGRIWNSGINDPTTWTALGVIAMQNEPNGGVAIAKLFNYVVGFGVWTTEFFYDNANPAPASPLAPNTTFPFQVGCANGESVIEMQNSIVWIGQTKKEGQGVYMFQDNNPVRISTPFIDRILQNDPLTSITAFNVDAAGYSCYIVTLETSNITLCYSFDTQLWSIWTSLSPRASVTVQSMTCDPYGLVTVNATSHGLSDGDPVTITGASNPLFNGLVNAQVVNANQFTFQASSNLGTNAGTAVLTGYNSNSFIPVASAQVRDIDYLQDPLNGIIYSQVIGNFSDNGVPIDGDIVTERWDGGTSEWKYLRRLSLLGDFEASNCMVAYSDTDYMSYSAFRTMSLQQGQRATLTPAGRFRRRAFRFRHTALTPFRAEVLELEVIKGDF